MSLKTSLVASLLLLTTLAEAMQFQTIGYKSISMGGAGVANSSSSLATYNNPALLAKAKYDVEVSLGAGASTYDHGAGASMQSLEDTGFMDLLDRASDDLATLKPDDITTLRNGKDVILKMDGNSAQVAPQLYLAGQVYGYGFGVFGTSDLVALANVSQTHVQLIFENDGKYFNLNGTLSNSNEYQNTSMEYAINKGDTHALVNAIGVFEVPIAYGHKFELSEGNLYVGASLKYMQAVTYQEKMSIDDDQSFAKTEEEISSNFGLDFGLAYEPKDIDNLTLALVAKNINAPEFSVYNKPDVKIDPMLRAGVAYEIFDSLEVALDMDLTSNKTFIPGVDSQMLGGGINYHPSSWFSIRAGLMENMDSNDKAKMIYTLGLGLGLQWFQIDISGQMSGQSQTVNGTSYPQYAKLNIAILSRW